MVPSKTILAPAEAEGASVQPIANASTAVWGVDPGIGGAVVAVVPNGPQPHYYAATPPRIKVVMSSAQKNARRTVIDIPGFHAALKRLYLAAPPRRVLAEKASAHPNQGVVAMFSYGYFSAVYDVLIYAITGLEPEKIYPPAWKRQLFLTSQEWEPRGTKKKKAVILANKLLQAANFPNPPFDNCQDGMAEAFLLACFCDERLFSLLQKIAAEQEWATSSTST